jgi:hypothetical protein
VIRFISFATPGFEEPMRIVLETARRHGADSVRGWTGDDIRALSIYPDYREVLDAPRGAGYWAWKPLIILEELNALPEGDVLIYSDAGRADRPYRIDRPLREVVDWVLRERDGMLPGVYIPQWGANQRWTKAECFAAMGCDTRSGRRTIAAALSSRAGRAGASIRARWRTSGSIPACARRTTSSIIATISRC